MSTDAFDPVTRRAAGAVSRRHTLLTLGGTALAAGLALPMGGEAKPSPAKKAKKKCKRQVGQCTAYWNERCEEVEGGCDAEQLEAVLRCCEPFKSCDPGRVLECLFAELLG